jgi:hypothetical protein
MRSIPLLVLSLIFATACTAQTPKERQYEGSLGSPVYSGGYVITHGAVKVSIYGAEGPPVYAVRSRSDQQTRYYELAIDSDGVAARAFDVREAKSMGGRIELLDAGGKSALTIKTGAYSPQYITFAPDHSIWTVGFEYGYEPRAEDFNTVRHYARTGEELGQALPWRQIAAGMNAYTALQAAVGGRKLYIANDRIGFQARLRPEPDTWVEVNFAGMLLGKYDMGRFREFCYLPRAMTGDGSVYALTYREDRFDGWAVLDRSRSEWRKTSGSPKGSIIGSDANNLVFAKAEGGWTLLDFVASGLLTVEKQSDHKSGDQN